MMIFRSIKRLIILIIFIIGGYSVITTVWFPDTHKAHAVGMVTPSMQTASAGDVILADSAITKILNFVIPEAHAMGPEKPSVLTQSSGDVTKADSAITKIVNFVLYFIYAGGTIALCISLFMCLPFIGKSQVGLAGLKGSIVVLLAAGLINVLFSFIGKLMS